MQIPTVIKKSDMRDRIVRSLSVSYIRTTLDDTYQTVPVQMTRTRERQEEEVAGRRPFEEAMEQIAPTNAPETTGGGIRLIHLMTGH